jgi:hypothetical protein
MKTASVCPVCTEQIRAVQVLRKVLYMSQNLNAALISIHDKQRDLTGHMKAPLRTHQRPRCTGLCLLAHDVAHPRPAAAIRVIGTSGAATGMSSPSSFSTSACAPVDFEYALLAFSMSVRFHFASVAFSTEWSDLRNSNEYSFITHILVYLHSGSAGVALWGERGGRGATCVDDSMLKTRFTRRSVQKAGIRCLLRARRPPLAALRARW